MKRLNLLIFTLLTGLTMLGQVSFKVVPPRNVIAGQRFQVSYRLSNAEGHSLKAPAIDGCTLLYGPSTSTSYSRQFINGVESSSSAIDYTYIYRADKEGTYTIPEASIIADGKTFTTTEAKFKVLPADEPQSGGNGAILGDYDSQTPDKAISKDDIFVRIILNKSSAYEQEAIECILKLYTKYQSITSFSQTAPPTYDGFLIDEGDAAAQLNEIENFNGQNYVTAVLKKAVIFPQKTGQLTISSGSYDVTVQQMERVSNGYFYMSRPVEKDVKLRPYTATINIKPLPQPQPVSFNGAVGKFTVDRTLSSSTLRTNEAASLTVTVKGTGNIKYLKQPDIAFPSEFEVYNPTQNFDTRVAGTTVTGTMTAEYTFVPETVGEFVIPEDEFSYFDPSSGQYLTVTLPPYEISVAKGNAVVSDNVDRQDIKLKNTDILHIHLGDKHLSKGQTFYAHEVWYWLSYIAIVIAFIFSVILVSKRIKANADVTGRKMSQANKVARKRLSLAAKSMKAGHNEQFYEDILKALWGYLSDKLAIPVSGLTRNNISDVLEDYGVSPEIRSHVISILDDCEMARYTPESATTSPENIYESTIKVMNELETVKKKQPK